MTASDDAGKPAAAPNKGATSSEDSGLPPLDFSTFVMSLGSSAMINLGQVPPPDGDGPHIDLAAAKQIIDILGILEEKTKDNLDDAERKLLHSLLYELRIKYVDAQKTGNASE